MVWKRRLTKLLCIIVAVFCMGLGNIQGSFDLYIPRDHSQPWLRTMTVLVDGKPYGWVAFQDSFIVGLQPNWDIQVCWSDPGYEDCLPSLSWYPSASGPNVVNKKGVRAGENGHGGPRYDALTGESKGYR